MEPVNFDLIFNYAIRMTLSLIVVLLLYTIKVAVSNVETFDWYRSNGVRIALGFFSLWALAAAIVISPEITTLLGGLGFNADQSPAALAFVVGGFLIGAISKPVEVPK